jgi:hypothetical protein
VKVVIDGRVYEARALDSLSLKHALAFNAYCELNGHDWRWTDVEVARLEMVDQTKEERRRHPASLMITALTIWATRVGAGDDVTFDDVISAPLASMQFIDVSPAAEATAPDPPQARPGSGRAGSRGGPKAKTRTSAKTSARESTRG